MVSDVDDRQYPDVPPSTMSTAISSVLGPPATHDVVVSAVSQCLWPHFPLSVFTLANEAVTHGRTFSPPVMTSQRDVWDFAALRRQVIAIAPLIHNSWPAALYNPFFRSASWLAWVHYAVVHCSLWRWCRPVAVCWNPSHNYWTSPAVWDRRVLPATQHWWTRPT